MYPPTMDTLSEKKINTFLVVLVEILWRKPTQTAEEKKINRKWKKGKENDALHRGLNF